MRTVYESKDRMYRIIEVPDLCSTFEDLAGDCFSSEANPSIPEATLQEDKDKFLNKYQSFGVFGYILERWNPEPGIGYEHIDSCFGFVGSYNSADPDFNHYIVEELIYATKK